jgi:hypothetical protein
MVILNEIHGIVMENMVVSSEFTENNKGWFHGRQNLLEGAGQG